MICEECKEDKPVSEFQELHVLEATIRSKNCRDCVKLIRRAKKVKRKQRSAALKKGLIKLQPCDSCQVEPSLATMNIRSLDWKEVLRGIFFLCSDCLAESMRAGTGEYEPNVVYDVYTKDGETEMRKRE